MLKITDTMNLIQKNLASLQCNEDMHNDRMDKALEISVLAAGALQQLAQGASVGAPAAPEAIQEAIQAQTTAITVATAATMAAAKAWKETSSAASQVQTWDAARGDVQVREVAFREDSSPTKNLPG